MDENSESNLKIRRHIRSSIVFQISLICGLVAAALVLVPLFAHYAGMIPEVTPRDFADSPVQKAIDQYSLQAERNITTLERIINKTLNVPVSTNEDGNLVVEYQGKRTTLDSSYILSEETIAEPTIAAEFASVEELAANGSLKAGDVVRTQSFYAGANRGGATYDVVETSADAQSDGMSRIGLANGLVAVIRPQNGMVSVDQLGAHADNSTDDYPYIQAAIDLGYKTVKFEGGDYRFDRQIDINRSELTILGNGSTLRYFEGFTWNADNPEGDYAFGIRGRSNSDIIEDVFVLNLNIINNKTTSGVNYSHTMVRVSNAEHVEFNNCDIVIDRSPSDARIRATNIDLRTYWHDIIIENCSLINRTYAEEGGSVWVRGGTRGTGKLIIKDNHIEKICHDECIALFDKGTTDDGAEYGYIDDVLIDGNQIIIDETDVDLPSAPVINIGKFTIDTRNVKLCNNDLDVKAAGGLFMVWNSTNVEVSDNNFNFTFLYRTDAPKLTSPIFKCERATSQNVSADNNSISVAATEGTQMGYLARGFDNFRHNNVQISAPMSAVFGECVYVDDNTIEIDTSDFRNYIDFFNVKEDYQFFSVYAWRDDVPDIISFTGNKITFNEKMFDHQDVRIVSVSDTEMSGTSLYVSDDVVKGVDGQNVDNKTMLSITGCQDTDGTSAIYALRNDSNLFETLDVSSNEDDGLYLVIDDESLSSVEP